MALSKRTEEFLDQVALDMQHDGLSAEEVKDPSVVAAYIQSRARRNRSIAGWVMADPDILAELARGATRAAKGGA